MARVWMKGTCQNFLSKIADERAPQCEDQPLCRDSSAKSKRRLERRSTILEIWSFDDTASGEWRRMLFIWRNLKVSNSDGHSLVRRSRGSIKWIIKWINRICLWSLIWRIWRIRLKTTFRIVSAFFCSSADKITRQAVRTAVLYLQIVGIQRSEWLYTPIFEKYRKFVPLY